MNYFEAKKIEKISFESNKLKQNIHDMRDFI